MLVFDRADQVGLGTEVVADGRIVALPGGLADLTVGDREDAVLGEEPLGGGEDRFTGEACPIGAGAPEEVVAVVIARQSTP